MNISTCSKATFYDDDNDDVNIVTVTRNQLCKTKDGYVHSANIGDLQNKFEEIDQLLLIAEYH